MSVLLLQSVWCTDGEAVCLIIDTVMETTPSLTEVTRIIQELIYTYVEHKKLFNSSANQHGDLSTHSPRALRHLMQRLPSLHCGVNNNVSGRRAPPITTNQYPPG